ncbi:MAG: histidinol phosphate phosphatase, partial [Alphaproteobacteria bacterium]|nr:histidinol phosphate phosphatase [Alphaproteobacteria bacterium]
MSLSRDDLLKVSLEILHAAKEPALRYFRTALQVSDKEDESPVTVGD